MANTYTQIHIQFVFAVKYRHSLLSSSWKKELYLYIAGIIEKQGHKLIAINGMPDHIHILVGMKPLNLFLTCYRILKEILLYG